MAEHTLTIEIDGPEPYVRYRLSCSENGGKGCATGVYADDCDDMTAFLPLYLAEALSAGLTSEESDDAWFAEVEHLEGSEWECSHDGWWWDGDHYHPRYGQGCSKVGWFDADPEFSWEPDGTIRVTLPVDVRFRGEDEPLAIRMREGDV